jgi:hypothetical protein
MKDNWEDRVVFGLILITMSSVLIGAGAHDFAIGLGVFLVAMGVIIGMRGNS